MATIPIVAAMKRCKGYDDVVFVRYIMAVAYLPDGPWSKSQKGHGRGHGERIGYIVELTGAQHLDDR